MKYLIILAILLFSCKSDEVIKEEFYVIKEELKEVTFFNEYTMQIPVSYSFTQGVGEDSYFFEVRSDSQDVVIEVERVGFFEYDTIFQVSNFLSDVFSEKKTVKNNKGEEIGIVIFKFNTASFRDYNGVFLIKENEYYFFLLEYSYASIKEKDLIYILSTIQRI